jgi:AcrR family transcriptional regulator
MAASTIIDAADRAQDNRRVPRQQRSRLKVDAILDATETLIGAGDESPVTTTVIAAQAGIAVGTVYRYFDGVPAIIEALAARHAEQFASYLREVLSGQEFGRKRDAANAALDALIDYYRGDAGFRALWHAAPRVTGTGFFDAAEEIIAIVMGALADQGLIGLVDEDLAREAQVQWAIATSLIQVAFSRDPDGDPAVLAHLRRCFDLDVIAV